MPTGKVNDSNLIEIFGMDLALGFDSVDWFGLIIHKLEILVSWRSPAEQFSHSGGCG